MEMSSSSGEEESEYTAFEGRQIRAVLFKLAPMSDSVQKEVTAYVHGGTWEKDQRFAREVFGKTPGRREYLDFWESPWVEEHVSDAARKRKIDSMQKASAVRNFVKNASTSAQEDVDKYMNTVDALNRWQDHNANNKEDVKTVSRMVQSFERVVARNLVASLQLGWAYAYDNARGHIRPEADMTVLSHTLRRHPRVFDLFASAVATEIAWADATSGTRNTPIYMCRQIQDNKEGAMVALVRGLDALTEQMELDTMGIPLMSINCNMYVSSNGVLIMGKDSTEAVYVLDMLNGFNANGQLDLSNVKTIHITQMVTEREEGVQTVRGKKSSAKKLVEL